MLSLDPESRAIEDVQRMLQDNLLPQQFAFITANFHKLIIMYLAPILFYYFIEGHLLDSPFLVNEVDPMYLYSLSRVTTLHR